MALDRDPTIAERGAIVCDFTFWYFMRLREPMTFGSFSFYTSSYSATSSSEPFLKAEAALLDVSDSLKLFINRTFFFSDFLSIYGATLFNFGIFY